MVGIGLIVQVKNLLIFQGHKTVTVEVIFGTRQKSFASVQMLMQVNTQLHGVRALLSRRYHVKQLESALEQWFPHLSLRQHHRQGLWKLDSWTQPQFLLP